MEVIKDMATTIVDTIHTPKYQKEYNFKNLEEKAKLCKELKRLEVVIASQLDCEHKKLFRQYAEAWDKFQMELNHDSFSSGMKFTEIHNR